MVWNWADTSTLGVTGTATIPASMVRWLTSAESLRATVRPIPRTLKTRATGSSTVAPSSVRSTRFAASSGVASTTSRRALRSTIGPAPGTRQGTLECLSRIPLPTLAQPLAPQLAPCLRVAGVRVEPFAIAGDGSIGAPRASEDPCPTDDGVALAGREPEGIIVRAQRVTVIPGTYQRVAHRHVAPCIGRLQGDVAAEQL